MSCSDNVDVDQITEKVSLLCVSLSRETSSQIGKTSLEAKVQSSEGFSFVKSSSDLQPFPVRATDAKLDSETAATIRKDDIIVLSDDETEKELSANQVVSSDASSEKCLSYRKIMAPATDRSSVEADFSKKNIPSVDSKDVLDISGEKEKRGPRISPLKQGLDESRGRPLGSLKPKAMPDKRNETDSEDNTKDLVKSQGRLGLMNQYVEPPSCKPVKQGSKDTVAGVTNSMLKNLVHDAEDDPLERALKSGRPQHSILTKSGPFVPKRQVIQLKSPFENRSGQLHRMGSGVKRFTPLRLDDWYRPILELDYFATVGLASVSHDGNRALSNLKEVPVCFQSPEQYVNIFRPLVLEEFKAQLQSSFLEMSSLEEMYSGWLSVLSVERVDDFHLVRFVHDEDETVASQSFSENDLVLLTREALQKTPHDFHVLGKVFFYGSCSPLMKIEFHLVCYVYDCEKLFGFLILFTLSMIEVDLLVFFTFMQMTYYIILLVLSMMTINLSLSLHGRIICWTLQIVIGSLDGKQPVHTAWVPKSDDGL